MDKWIFYTALKQDIICIAGEDIYNKYGQAAVTILENLCTEDSEIVRYPSQDEIYNVMYEVT